MGMKLLLDTNRLSDAMAEDEDVLNVLECAEAVYIPVIVLGERRAGFARGRRAAKNEERLQWLLAQDGILALGIDPPVSHRYADLLEQLRKRGRPIPTNDLWIAALAIHHGLVVYTRDRHFAEVPALSRL